MENECSSIKFKRSIDEALIHLANYADEMLELEGYGYKDKYREMIQVNKIHAMMIESKNRIANGWYDYWVERGHENGTPDK